MSKNTTKGYKAQIAYDLVSALENDRVFNAESVNASTGVAQQNINGLADAYLNTESLHISNENGENNKHGQLASTFEAGFRNAFNKVMHENNISTESVNYDAALTSAKMLLSPKSFFEKLDAKAVVPQDAVVINQLSVTGMQNDLDVKQYIERLRSAASDSANVNAGTKLNLLSYDGGDPNKFLYSTIMLNATANQQDDFANAFFPMIMMNPVDSYFVIESTVTNYIESYVHESGEANPDLLKQKNILKHLNDNSLTKDNRFAVFPNAETDDPKNVDLMLKDFAYTKKFDGRIVKTAPYKYTDKDISMFGLARLSHAGVPGSNANLTDSIDRTINLDALYIGKDGDGFKISTSTLATRAFISQNQGNVKDVHLTFSTEHSIRLSNVVSAKTAEDKGVLKPTRTPLITLTEGTIDDYIVTLKLELSASVTINTSYLSTKGKKLKLEAVYKLVDGVPTLIDSGEDYKAISDYFHAAEIIGYELKATRTNTNYRMGGLLLTNEGRKYAYGIPYRSGVMVKGPNLDPFGGNNDLLSIGVEKQALVINRMMSVHAVQVVDEFAKTVRDALLAGNKNIPICTPSGESIDAYHEEIEWDAEKSVDSLTNIERSECIQKSLIAAIRNVAINMMMKTNYKTIIDAIGAKIKPTLIIGTNEYIANYLTIDENKKFALTAFMDAMVVSSKNEILNGRENAYLGTDEDPDLFDKKYKNINGVIYLGLTILEDSNRNTQVNNLNYGFGVYSPSVNTDMLITRSDATSRELQTNPRFDHIPQLPITGVVIVKGIDKVLGKLPQYQKQV